MGLKKQKLLFGMREDWTPKLAPAKNFIPEWYKDIPAFNRDVKSLPASLNLKACMPFLDSLTIGYILPLPFDIAVEQRADGPFISWNVGDVKLIGTRDKSLAPNIPVPAGYDETTHFVWEMTTAIQTPPGYSMIYTHPFNRYDLPFITLTGVPDGDTAPIAGGNAPFFLKKGFEGIIKAGTPIVQIIPFKRDSWISEENYSVQEEAARWAKRSLAAAFGWYKTHQWQKKSYD